MASTPNLYYKFQPLTNITAYELAVIIRHMGPSFTTTGSWETFVVAPDQLTNSDWLLVKRHFQATTP